MQDFTKIVSILHKAGISTGITEPDFWISSGNLALNYIMSGDFKRGIPNRRTVFFWGLSGSGKSLLLCQAALNAQKAGYTVVYIDTEYALSTQYANKIGLDLSEDKFLLARISTLEELTKLMSELLKELPKDLKVCFVLDSLSNLKTEKEVNEFDSGTQKGDMGQFAKKSKLFMSNMNDKIGDRDAFFLVSCHAYMNQNVLNGEGTIIPTGGQGIIFLPTISVKLSKLKLKDEKEIVGVKVTAEISKSRFAKLGGKITLEVPYDTGIDPLDGLLELLVAEGDVERAGAWYKYTTHDGKLVTFRAADLKDHYETILEMRGDKNVQP